MGCSIKNNKSKHCLFKKRILVKRSISTTARTQVTQIRNWKILTFFPNFPVTPSLLKQRPRKSQL